MSEEAERDTVVAAGMVAPSLRLHEKEGRNGSCSASTGAYSSAWVCARQSRKTECKCPVTEAPKPATSAVFHGKWPWRKELSLGFSFFFFFCSCVLIMCELLLVFTFFPDYCCSHSSKAITEAQVRNVCLLLKWPATQDFNYHPLCLWTRAYTQRGRMRLTQIRQ